MVFVCTISTERAPSLRFLQEPALGLPKGMPAPVVIDLAFDLEVARVGRTLLSDAFDVDCVLTLLLSH